MSMTTSRAQVSSKIGLTRPRSERGSCTRRAVRLMRPVADCFDTSYPRGQPCAAIAQMQAGTPRCGPLRSEIALAAAFSMSLFMTMQPPDSLSASGNDPLDGYRRALAHDGDLRIRA